MVLRWVRATLLVGCALVGAAGRLPGDSEGLLDLCVLRPFDTTNENGFGASAGNQVEYCTPVPVQGLEECVWYGWYFVDPAPQVTRIAPSSSIIDLETLMRGGPGPGQPPGAVRAGPDPLQATSVPLFPNALEVEALLSEAAGGPVSASTVLFACAILDGTLSPNQFLAVDQSPATPARPCWARTNAGPFEDCFTFVPTMRALKIAMLTSQFRADGTANQVVPPSGSGRTLRVRANQIDSRALEFHLSGEHDVANPTAVRIRRGSPGVVGPIVTTLASPESPIKDAVVLDIYDLSRLSRNRLYVEVTDAANPNGAARGQLTPANWIFGSGFETGNVAYWSVVQP